MAFKGTKTRSALAIAARSEAGFNGVSLGGEVISVKFSSDPGERPTITGTMEAAYNYAAELADSLALVGRPVVVNMSFGIGSSYEGKAKMEEMIDDIIAKHSNLYVVTSAGNEGPGLSSVGIPAAAALPISVGAALPRGIARDAYGAAIEQDILWNFSSRGGEVDKPDVVAPGTAISTVPRFSFDMRASGTSMASPYTAGVIALLLSAAAEEYPGWIPAQSLIRRALRTSARRLPQYAAIEQGGGMVDVTAAWALIKRWKASGYAADFQEYTVTTDSPGYIDGSGSAAYWRTGWMPTSEYRQEFRVARRTIAAYPIDDDEFFRAYRLSSTVDWMTPIQQTVFIRGDRYAKVEVLYDPEKMEEPGLYSGRIIGRRERGDRATPEDEIEFELAATFTLPHRLTATNNYRVATTPRAIGPGELDRHYVALPPGASGLRMALSVDEGAQATVSAVIVDRHGVIATYLPEVDGRDRTESTALIDAKELGDGIVEIVIKGEPFTGSGGTADYTLAIEGVMIDFDIATLRRPSGVDDLVVTATNVGTDPVEGRLGYTVKGYERIITDTLRDPSRPYHRSVTLTPHDGALWVSVVFAPEDYMRSTDILLRLLDSTGLSQGSQAYHGPSEWVFLPNFYRDGIARDFTLELVFGAASQADVATDPIPFRIIERHVRPTEFEKLGSGRNDRIFYPFLPRSMSTLLPALEGGIPAGYYPIGELRFRPDSRDDDEEILIEFPVH
mgnify:CR=1 FL=1